MEKMAGWRRASSFADFLVAKNLPSGFEKATIYLPNIRAGDT
jgi:hypothetical protein